MRTKTDSVTACIPYFKGKPYIRRAVESLLTQTHRALDLVVVNDGDPDPPWDQLTGIRDPRLIRFDLRRNHGGPFFANAVVVNAVSSPYFLVQEQDDWSEPERISRLLDLLAGHRADVAISAQYFHQENPNRTARFIGVRWCGMVDTRLTGQLRYRAPHAGLFRVNALRTVGGYYAGLPLHYDSLLMHLLMMTGKLCHTPIPLYHRLLQPRSLTHAANTGPGSQAWNTQLRVVTAMYRRAFAEYQRYLAGKLSSEGFTQALRQLLGSYVSRTDKQDLAAETHRLRSVISRTHLANP